MCRSLLAVAILALLVPAPDGAARAQQTTRTSQVPTPEQFFGFRIGTDGEQARYPKILEYLQHLTKSTTRVKYEELGKTTMGNPYVLATISAPENLAKLTRLIEINRRLADPRGLPELEAKRLAPGFSIQSEVVSRYPKTGPILQSGWLLGEDLLRDQANVVAFRVGRGYVVTLGTQVDFRAQTRATYKLLFNAMFHGPSTLVPAADLARLSSGTQCWFC